MIPSFRRIAQIIGQSAKLFYVVLLFIPQSLLAQSDTVSVHAEGYGTLSNGPYAPLWLTAGRYGISSVKPKSTQFIVGGTYSHAFSPDFGCEAGLDLGIGTGMESTFLVQQVYADFNFRDLHLTLGSKRQGDFPHNKDLLLSSGNSAESDNSLPIPQARISVADYVNVPGTKKFFAFKGHLAFGIFTDDAWHRQHHLVNSVERIYTQQSLYHSKSLMLRFGNTEAFPLTFEVGLYDFAQFGAQFYRVDNSGQATHTTTELRNFSAFIDAILPLQKVNTSLVGNHSGSWLARLTYHGERLQASLYLDHFYEDQSQIFFQYGLWRDGLLGLQLTFPKFPWVERVVVEGISTYDQTGPILYDSFAGSFTDIQWSGCDEYFNNLAYGALQHWGMQMGNALIPGPAYNPDGTNYIRNARMRAIHLGLRGRFSLEWRYRFLGSYAHHWGTYIYPLPERMYQLSTMAEVTYNPLWAPHWSASAAVALDRGTLLGHSVGGALRISYNWGTAFGRRAQ